MLKVGIYVRVSTDEQTTMNQLIELREFCKRMNYEIYKEYVDEGISGSKIDRPALDEMMKDVFSRKFDTLIVWKLDRLGRSLQHLIEILDELKNRNIDFVSTTQNIDTTTPSGKLYFHLLGAFAEFEREQIRERIKVGMKRAKAEGKIFGRPIKNDKLSRTTLWRRKKLFHKVGQNQSIEMDKSGQNLGV